VTGWHRDHARKVLRAVLVFKEVKPHSSKPPLYGAEVIQALRFCWAVHATGCAHLLAAAAKLLKIALVTIERLDSDAHLARGWDAEWDDARP
jgi:hypothetical protein